MVVQSHTGEFYYIGPGGSVLDTPASHCVGWFRHCPQKQRTPSICGLWERWKDRQTSQDLLTSRSCWFKPDAERLPIDLLRPYDADKMMAWKVDNAIDNVNNDRPQLIDPISATSKETGKPLRDGPGSLFT
jgi:hypothetical protein